MAEDNEDRLIHVLGTVDLQQGTGEFLYVNPIRAGGVPAAGVNAGASGSPDSAAPPPRPFELVAQSAQGRELGRFRPPILLPSEAGDNPTDGMIDVAIPFVEGMRRLVLLYAGKEAAVFEAGPPAAVAAGGPASGPAIAMGAAPLGHPEKREMTVEGVSKGEPGVSYTVQVRPEGHQAWQTIAVGKNSPDFQLDRNQFPGAASASVRVLRSTGFDSEVIDEKEVDLRFGE
ncbi:hypothetical protein [Microvirga lotononidis]|uniref:Uncharacterized protein n=1 Tax=Microvirga lotononidis TaxID=864069 RepID=I4Z4K9_9HYPH|nr:hypothetical protein [Microvirga lotononidis]EIM31151.1 hypothetical protein MicloDRAFT_00001410 [Microvirga lotononidis]WQO30457.1 hypothetical protein U0023_23670 [Microvirga lotononidis]